MARFTFGWGRPHVPKSVQRLQRVMGAALSDPHYRALLEAAGLGSAQAIRSITSLEAGLDALPFSRPEQLSYSGSYGFPRVVRHPLRPDSWACAPSGSGEYRALAASMDELRAAALRPLADRPTVEQSILVLRHPDELPLSARDRDRLWCAFGVPVYEAIAGLDGIILVHECEAQSGFHATERALIEEHSGRLYLTSLSDTRHPWLRVEMRVEGSLATVPCECGRSGVRIAAPAAEHEPTFSSAAD